MTGLDLLCRETVESAHMPRVMVGRFLNTNEPAAAVETAGDYLRKPAATVSGQIVREGDAPRETGRHDGGVASCPDAESQAKPEEAVGGKPASAVDAGSRPVAGRSATATSERKDVTAGRDPHFNYWSRLRPFCQQPDMCPGYGEKHCSACRKLMKTSEAA